MKARMLAFACAALVLAWSTASFSEPQLASAADGKAMLDRAIAALKANEAAALKAFNDEKNKDSAIAICMSIALASRMGILPPIKAR
jgi:hypothetical protein